MVTGANVDPWERPVLSNPDGSYSTTSSISIGTDQGETVIPTVVNGVRLSTQDAVKHFQRTGQHLGMFKTVDDAEKYSTDLHNAQATLYDKKGKRLMRPTGASLEERGVFAGEGVPLPTEDFKPNPVPRITADDAGFAAYEKLSPGSPFIKPSGEQALKPYEPKTPEDYLRIPEGEFYFTPKGDRLQKPKYEGISTTAETLYNMAKSPEEKRRALGVVYGEDNVKDDYDNQPYVQDGKTRRRPGRSAVNTVLGHVAADAAPTLGAIGGGLLGGMSGSLVPGAGTALGTVGGAALGGAAGQGFNDSVLALAGVNRRSIGEETKELALAGGSAGVGQGAGEVLSAIPKATSLVTKDLSQRTGRMVGKFFGMDKAPVEDQETAKRLAESGVRVPPSAHMKEAPYLTKLVETLDPAFRGQRVLEQSANEHYEKKSAALLKNLGIEPAEKLTSATKPVSSQAAGEGITTRYNSELAAADQKLAAQLQMYRNRVVLEGKSEAESLAIHRANLEQAAQESRAAAQKVADGQIAAIRGDVDTMVKAANAGENAGDIWRGFAGKIDGSRKAIRLRAQSMYDVADTASGGVKPDIAPLLDDAHAFIQSLPEAFQSKHPDIVKRLNGLEAGEVTFGQLHLLRSMLRSDIEYGDLTPSIRDGALKRFAGKVDEVLHQAVPKVQGPVRLKDPGESLPRYGREALPEGPKVDPRGLPEGTEKAARLLDQADAFYAKNMPRYRDEVFQAIVKATDAGLPADPKALARLVLQPEYAERITKLRRTVGPSLWGAVQAADTQLMLDGAKTMIPGEIDGGKFAAQVLDRVRNGIFDAAYSPQLAGKLKEAARRLSTVEGKLSIDAQPGDTVTTLLKKAEVAESEAKALADKDPLGTMERELKRLDTEFAAQRKTLRTSDPHFNFLEGETSAAAAASADKILGNPTLLVAAGLRFGEGSAEFTALRQTYVHRLLQRDLTKTKNLGKEFAENISEETQKILFPGTTLAEAKQLARDMSFLLGKSGGGDIGGGIMATQRVMHPLGAVPVVGGILKHVPGVLGVDTAARAIQSKYYQMMTWGATNPAFVQWIYAGLRAGPVERQRVAQAVRKAWGAVGAGGAALGAQESR